MNAKKTSQTHNRAPALLLVLLLCVGCGDDNGPEDEQTGTVLQGTVTSFQAQLVGGGFGLAANEGVTVAIGSKSTETDANGDFTLRDFAIGTQNLLFARDGGGGTLVLTDVGRGDEYDFQFSISGGDVSTQHTGTWVGTGGSTDSTSQGQVALTMIIAQNGNALTGTASIDAGVDTTSWNISGTETGHTATGLLTVTTTNSECAASGDFEGTFAGDTLSGTFIEVDPPAGCGEPEPGIFNVVKQ